MGDPVIPAQPKSGGQSALEVPILNKLAESGGEPLPMPLKQEMEAKFGQELSKVKVHTGPVARQVCQMMGAKSYSVGNHVCFAPGEYQPFTQPGQTQIASEVSHIIVDSNTPAPEESTGNN